MRVLITGAHGFIGSHFRDAAPSEWYVWTPEALTPHTHSGCDLCIHLAARVRIRDGMARPHIDWNSLSTLTDVLQQGTFGRFVFVSSGAVYQGAVGRVSPEIPVHPTIPYAIAKLAGEQLVEHYHNMGRVGEFLNVRLFGAYGPGEAAHKLSTKLMTATTPVTIEGDGENLIDPMYVGDVVQSLINLATGTQWNRTVDLATGRPLSIREWVEEIGRVVDIPEVSFGGPRPPEYHRFWATEKGRSGLTPPAVGLRKLAESLGVPCRS